MDRATRGRSDVSRWKCAQHTGSVVTRTRNDELAVRRVSNRLDREGMPLERIADCGTSLGIPDSNGVIVGFGGAAGRIGRESTGGDPSIKQLERIADCGTSLGIPDSNGVIVG